MPITGENLFAKTIIIMRAIISDPRPTMAGDDVLSQFDGKILYFRNNTDINSLIYLNQSALVVLLKR
jgi:hypothetical protein